MSDMGMVENNGQYSVMMFDDMSTYTFDDSHINYDELVEAYNERDSDRFKELSNVGKTINASLSDTDRIELRDGAVYMDGEAMDNRVCDKIVQFYEANIDYGPLVNFLVRLQKNPSKRSVDQLFLFLEHENIAIASDGRFLAYKSVREDYTDKYSGKFNNSVGSICSMPRNRVDDNPDAHCSHGFHVGALSYAGPDGWFNSPGDKVMIVAVDPEHAVSVPSDHSSQKLRVCEYEVIGEFERPLGVFEDTRTYKVADVEDLEVGDIIKFVFRSELFEGSVVESISHEDYELETDDGYYDFDSVEECQVLC